MHDTAARTCCRGLFVVTVRTIILPSGKVKVATFELISTFAMMNRGETKERKVVVLLLCAQLFMTHAIHDGG